jgi:hypothetical protein
MMRSFINFLNFVAVVNENTILDFMLLFSLCRGLVVQVLDHVAQAKLG